MTNDELLSKAIKAIERLDGHMPESLRNVTVERLPKRRFREAVVIDFEGDEGGGTIQVTIERDTGEIIGMALTPPKKKPSEAA